MVFPIILGSLIGITLLGWLVGYSVLLKFVKRIEKRWSQLSRLLHRYERIVHKVVHKVQDSKRQHDLLLSLASINDPSLTRHERLHWFNHINALVKEIQEHEAPTFFNIQEERIELEQLVTYISYEVQAYEHELQLYNKGISTAPTKFVARIHQFENTYGDASDDCKQTVTSN
ncbi:hypothetical protein [Geomicrobium sp. JCM 19038]|uniref:hypothetical protein n=1 Tax=Geomicrobium sp. JCM 19038 TaxID=1460635 RepID=UPI00045F2F03|nr:hypothetical protein [Geomicrobium sp. JCM 19038]GAK10291.1 hypothetical protein JCM19038_4180 [Geomicrobium sp. JCM 19038]